MHTLDPSVEQEDIVGDNSHFDDSSSLNAPSAVRDIALDMQYDSELQASALRQMEYDSNFTEDINLKMRVPPKLTVATKETENFVPAGSMRNGDIMSKMEVPDRIVVSVGDSGIRYGGTREPSESLLANDFLSDRARELVSLVTPPRKLTLAERNLDNLDMRNYREADDSKGDENVAKTSESLSILTEQMVPDVQHNESLEELDDVSLLRRQIFKLHRRITAIEKQQADRSKRDMYFYAATVAFWLINGWFLYSSKRPY